MTRKIAVIVVGEGRSGRPGRATAPDVRPLLGRPAAGYVLDAVSALGPQSLHFVHPEGDREVSEEIAAWYASRKKKPSLGFAAYKPSARPEGGRIPAALLHAGSILGKPLKGDVLLVASTQALLRSASLKSMVSAHRKHGCSLTLESAGDGKADTGTALVRAEDVLPLLPGLGRGRKGPVYDSLVELLVSMGKKVGIYESPAPDESRALTRPADFERAARILQAIKNEALARRGVVFLDSRTAWVDWDATVGPGTVVYPSVFIEGATRIGRGCRIYPHVHITNSRIGDEVRILDCTVIDDSVLETGVQAGPFSRLRPGTVIRAGSRVGNFVEMKNTVFGPRSKAQHLSYLGDSLVEEGVNIGAGTITCNYDGFRKSRTHIEAGVFIGSGTELIAPVRVGKGAYVAAGSTISRDVSPECLVIARARQMEKPGWVLQKIRERKKARKP